jgi:hypothetical protein
VPAQVFWAVDADGDWSVGSNWSTGREPGSGDTAILDRASGAYVVTVSSGVHYPGAIQATTSRLRFTGGAFWTRGALDLEGGLTLEGGQLNLQNPLTTNGDTLWTGGYVDGYGGSWTNNGTVTLTGAAAKAVNAGGGLTVVNNGTFRNVGSGDLQVAPFATFTNSETGTVELDSDAGIVGQGGFTGTLQNQGLVVKADGSGVSAAPAVANQGGTLEVLSGTLRLGGADKAHTQGGTFFVDAGAALDLTSGAHDGSFQGPYTGSGDGAINVSVGTLGFGGQGASFNFPDGQLQWTGGTFGGGLTNLGVITLDGAATKQLNGNLANDGVIVQKGSGPLQVSATLTNQADGFYDLQSDASLTGGGSVNNVGYFLKAGGDGVSAVEPTFTNNGTLELDSGTLAFSHTLTQLAGTTYLSGTLTFTGGMLDVRGGAVEAQGVINGDVRNAGVIDVGWAGSIGSLAINGNYTQTATGVLNVEIGSVDGVAVNDYLYVSGRVTLGGTLNVLLLTDEVPTPDESFRVMDFGARTGDFTAVNLPDLGAGAYLAPFYDDGGLTLAVLPT